MDGNNPFANLIAAVEESSGAGSGPERQVNELIEHIFAITINRTPQKGRPLLFMDGLASDNPGAKLINMEMFEQALFERLLIPRPHECVIPSNTHISDADDIFSGKVMVYLYRTYERLMRWMHHDTPLKKLCAELRDLIIRNASTAMKQPMIYENQSMSDQWLTIFRDNQSDEIEFRQTFLSAIVADIYGDDMSDLDGVEAIFKAFFDECLTVAKRASLDTVELWLVPALECFVADKTNAHLARLLLDYTTPKRATNATVIGGIAYSESLLGALLSLSLLPKTHQGEYEYYGSAGDRQSATYTDLLYSRLASHQDQMHAIFKGLLLVGGDIRGQTLDWMGGCIHANAARGQIWNAQNMMQRTLSTAPDSFMIGLCAVLLRLCKPLLRPKFKVLDVDATYCAVVDADRARKSVHMVGADKETCLIPVPDEGQPRHTADTYTFVTEVFYMAHRAIDLSYRICVEKFVQLSREMQRVQTMYREMLEEGGGAQWDSNMMASMERQMKKVLCLQKLLTEPSNDQLLLQFYEGTAQWLARNASKVPADANVAGAEASTAELRLPLETPAPKCLASIPEYILENIVVYLTFVRHFEELAIDTDVDAKNAIFTVILVFMGDVTRVRNPHLRARLAEGMETLLPKQCNSTFGCGSRGLLFTQHPHRLDIVRNVLSVFVAIEMTGQNVQFEQKFNYRRPMYQIMEYLWEIDEQRACFRRLAIGALEQMEAVNAPLFLRFINLLINDAIFLLDESLSNMKQIQQLQTSRDSDGWRSLPAQEREQSLMNLQHTGMLARFDNILGRDTVNMLILLTGEVPEIFCHPSMVDRVAAMLNYFLSNLVGPNQKNFIVKDKKEFDFDPAQTVMNICRIYINLQKCDAFCLAVSQDGRSYKPKLFEDAERILAKIRGGQLVGEITEFAQKVKQLEREEKDYQEALSDPPDEFLDPIMSTLMTDPVILPSSHVTVDRTTISRHLLSDQTDPFNRAPLTMDQVMPDVELKAKIQSWIAERKKERSEAAASVSQ